MAIDANRVWDSCDFLEDILFDWCQLSGVSWACTGELTMSTSSWSVWVVDTNCGGVDRRDFGVSKERTCVGRGSECESSGNFSIAVVQGREWVLYGLSSKGGFGTFLRKYISIVRCRLGWRERFFMGFGAGLHL